MPEQRFTYKEANLIASTYSVQALKEIKQTVLDANAPACVLNQVNLLIEKAEALAEPNTNMLVNFYSLNPSAVDDSTTTKIFLSFVAILVLIVMFGPWLYGAYKLFQLI